MRRQSSQVQLHPGKGVRQFRRQVATFKSAGAAFTRAVAAFTREVAARQL